ncbi:MAG: hydrogenase expression/formation protein HypE [Alphaproteobacteria bacterium]|nr:hydrogenase expression/formation protein HypE [Alphaproteobacteria bacterium]
MTAEPAASNWPAPAGIGDRIQMGHGGGGRMMQDLIHQVIEPAFRNRLLEQRHDGAIFPAGDGEWAFTTDGYVVQPLFFPGGDIGKLAVNGAINDLAMCGAAPGRIAISLILEEGFPIADLRRIVGSMAEAAAAMGAEIVTGDTKVVERGKGDGVFVTASAVGSVRVPAQPLPSAVRPGDVVLISGDIGRHGIAVMAARADLTFDPPLFSDCAPLWPAVAALIEADIPLHCLRDLTRGGLAAGLVEVAETALLGVEVETAAIPVTEPVRNACELFGLEPMHVANEGCFLAFVPPDDAAAAIAVLRAFGDARLIGRVCEEQSGAVTLVNPYGTRRRLRLPNGEQLPRIC